MDKEETEEETEEESSDEEMEEEDPEEDPEEESTDEDSSDDMSESEPEGETREAPEGGPVEMPVEEPVVTEIDPEVQIPTLQVEAELGQEDRGVQERDIHMIIPPIFEPLSPYYSTLLTEPVESMSPFTEMYLCCLGRRAHSLRHSYLSTTTLSIHTSIPHIFTHPISTSITSSSTTPSYGPRRIVSSCFPVDCI